MAIEVCSEISSPGFSPRISFSHDLDKANSPVPKEEQQQLLQRLDSSLVDSSSDFDFCIVNNIKLELSSADELFSNGKILPVQIKPTPTTTTPKETLLHPPHQSATKNTEKKRLKEFLEDSNAEDESNDNEEKPPIAKPSWQFRRSSSLNFDSTTARGMNIIRSLHFLSRSNSTGSAPNPKQTFTPNQKQQHLQKNQSTNSRRRSSSASSSSCSSSTTYYPYNTSPRSLKPSLRKSGSYGSNGIRISPVLNLPPPYISKVTVSFFGFGSLFCNGKLKKKKK
ncbi:uncharacterized protein LOC126791977 [Argentina anserina]|uniref:uncharacterized protein LOC126791977 n=1 Tax=Argentina anserina TaxID=57926 RepID=UPI0021766465|nr:uncharacterized protein LOC126791977 [Potentilla anserina]